MEVLFPAGTDFVFVKYCIVAVCFLLGIIMIGGHKRSVKRINSYYFIVFFFFISIVLHTILLSTEYEESMERALFTFSAISTFFLFIHYENLLLKSIKGYLFLLTAMILISSNFLIITSPGSLAGGFRGMFLNPNILGFHICIIALPYFFNITAKEYFKEKKIFTYNNLIVLNLLILIIFSKTRSAMLVTAIISLVLLFRYEKRTKKRFSILFFTGLLALLIASTTNFFHNIVNKYEDSESVFSTREYLYLSRFNGIIQRPYRGWGFQVNPTHGNYIAYHSSNKLEKGNMYLALIEEFGIFLGGIMIFIILYIARRSLDAEDDYFFISLTIIATLIHLNFESWFLNFNAINSFIFWIYVFLVPLVAKKRLSGRFSSGHAEQSIL